MSKMMEEFFIPDGCYLALLKMMRNAIDHPELMDGLTMNENLQDMNDYAMRLIVISQKRFQYQKSLKGTL